MKGVLLIRLAFAHFSRFQARLALAFMMALVWPATTQGQLIADKVMHSFAGATTLDGAFLFSGLILGNDGVLYGTTWGGGTGAGGTVFRISPDGSDYRILHNFAFAPDGSAPYSSVVQGQDGALYGTTYWGGTSNLGAVFTVNTDGTGYHILHSFTSSPDGANPYAELVQGHNGYLYGTTWGGGTGSVGTVFKISTNGSEYAILHHFENGFVDGSTPYAGLIQGKDGALYGVTSSGGPTIGGTIFRLTTDGSSYQILHNFNFPEGAWPKKALIQANDGMLYGTTTAGGSSSGGVVFRVGTDGLGYAVLFAFPSGSNPSSSLFQDSGGALYGTTESGGAANGGTAFRLQADGSGYAVLHEFGWSTGADGSQPMAGFAGRGGVLFGTTNGGGDGGFGTAYSITIAPVLSISRLEDGLHVTLKGLPGQSCRLDSSTNLGGWMPRANLILTDGSADFLETDTSPTNCFYRAVVQ